VTTVICEANVDSPGATCAQEIRQHAALYPGVLAAARSPIGGVEAARKRNKDNDNFFCHGSINTQI
jgi:hypothetical protein